MKTSYILSGLISLALLCLLPITLFGVYLYQPDSKELTASNPQVPFHLLFQRNISLYDAYSYHRTQETCHYLNSSINSQMLTCASVEVFFTIYSVEQLQNKTNRFILQFVHYTELLLDSNNPIKTIKTNESLTDTVSFYLNENFQFHSLIYSNLTNKTLIELARSIIFQFSPNLNSNTYNQSEFNFEKFGSTNFYSKRTLTTINNSYILFQELNQNDSVNFRGNSSYSEKIIIDKNSGLINETLANQTMIMPMNFKLGDDISSINSTGSYSYDNNEMNLTVCTITQTLLQKHTVDKSAVLLSKFYFLSSHEKILDYYLFANANETRKTNISSNKSNSSYNALNFTGRRTAENYRDYTLWPLGSFKMFDIFIELFVEVDRKDHKIKITPLIQVDGKLRFYLFPFEFLDESLTDTPLKINKLLRIFLGDSFLTKIFKSGTYKPFSVKPNEIKLPKMPILPIPPNPLFITGYFFIEFYITPVLDFFLERIFFLQKLQTEVDFSKDEYKETKLYNKDSVKDKDEINALLELPLTQLFTASRPLKNGVQIGINVMAGIGVDVSLIEIGGIYAKLIGKLVELTLDLSFDMDYFERKSQLTASIMFSTGNCRFQVYLYLIIVSKQELLVVDLPVFKSANYNKTFNMSVQFNIIDYDDSEPAASFISQSDECPLSQSDASNALCFTDSPCGCTLYPRLESISLAGQSFVLNRKGINDACETGEPLINEDFFNQYRVKINCLNPYKKIDQSTCEPVAGGFYIGEGYALSAKDQQLSIFDEIKDLPSDFFATSTIATAQKAKQFLLSKSTLEYYNKLLYDSKFNYEAAYNQRKYHEYLPIPSENNRFRALSRSIRTGFYLFMENFDRNFGSQNEVLLRLLKNFYQGEFTTILSFCAQEQNEFFCKYNNLAPVITLLKYSCSKCNYRTSSMDVRIVILLDGSLSIGTYEYSQETAFTSEFLQNLGANSFLKIKVAAIEYSSYSQLISNFTEDLEQLQIKINTTKKIDSSTDISSAFIMATSLFKGISDFKGSRFVFIITDGCSTSNYDKELQNLRKTAAVTFSALGVGDGINEIELIDYTGNPDNVILLSDFDSLKNALDIIGQEMCYYVEDGSENAFEGNLTLIGSSQKYFRVDYNQNLGKTIELSHVSGDFEVYASESYPYPNSNLHDYRGKKIDDKTNLFIPKNSIKNARILIDNLTNSKDFSTNSSIFVSLVYNLTNETVVEIKTYDNITIKMACFNNCLECDDSGQICFECQTEFALVNNKTCEYLNLTEIYYVSNYYQFENETKLFDGEREVLKPGLLAGLIIFCLIELILLIVIIMIGFTKLRKNVQEPPTIFSPTNTQT